MCQLWQCPQEPRISEVPSHENPGQTSGHRLHFPGSKHLETSRIRCQSGFAFFTAGLPGEPPDSQNVVVEQPEVEPQGKTPDDEGKLRRKVNRSSTYGRKVEETEHKQSNWQAQRVKKNLKIPK